MLHTTYPLPAKLRSYSVLSRTCSWLGTQPFTLTLSWQNRFCNSISWPKVLFV